MKKLAQLDRNFAVRADTDGLCYRDVAAFPEMYYGLFWNEENGFFRMPEQDAEKVNTQVRELATCTAGGRLRFVTNSKRIALQVQLQHIFGSANMAYIGTAGFDLYEKVRETWVFRCNFAPEEGECYAGSWEFPTEEERSLLIHFPLYAGVKKLELGLCPEATLEALPYPNRLPVMFYGSSITQGGCASRPGCAYTAQVSRMLDLDYRNLGFSSGARAEEAMIAYLQKQPTCLLVLDYDHNAPNPDFLAKTHYPLYEKLREALPDVPILLASAPIANPNAEWKTRRQTVYNTYQKAVAHGDNNVGFVDGMQMFWEEAAQECMVDIYHPNDLGMYCMAKAFAEKIDQLVKNAVP